MPPALQGHEKLDSPLDVLDALEACAAKGAARALCALAASSFRAATLLGMTCEEAASLGARQSLQVLLMKGPQAAPVRFCRRLNHRGLAVCVVLVPSQKHNRLIGSLLVVGAYQAAKLGCSALPAVAEASCPQAAVALLAK